MRYFLLMEDLRVPGRWHLHDPVEDDVKPSQLWSGAVVRLRGRPRIAVQVTGRPLDYCCPTEPVPIAVARLAEAIGRAAGDELQRIPAVVEGRDQAYEILNALHVVDCLDETRSTFMKWGPADGRPDKLGEYRMVTRLRVDPTRIPADAGFFRVRGWLVALVVSEDVKTAMEAAGCLGAKFERVD